MLLSKNALQNLFCIILAVTISFNASINVLLTQFSSISFIIFFLICLKNNETSKAIKTNYNNNRSFFIVYIIYLSYLIFQITPLPLSWIEIIAPNNYDLYSSIKIDKELWSLSIDPSSSYFSILNCINCLIIFLTFPSLFNRSRYLMKFTFFLCTLGFFHSIFATYWMLIGNPSNFLIEKVHYLNASTGLFINRSVYGTFLFLCAFSALYYIVIFFLKNKITNLNFIEQITSKIFLIRIFIIFLSLGILTTWSRAANFSYVLILFTFLFYSRINFKKFINPLSTVIIFILAFDVLVLGLYFGNARIIERYMGTSIINEIQRISYQEFGLDQFKNFWLFGYGNGAFEQIYKIFFGNHDALVQHVHNDGIELLGEVGIIGITILIVLSIFYFKKLIKGIHNKKELARFILISLLLLILFIQSLVDYSMHAPGILILLITILSIGLINFTNNNRY